MSKLCPRWHTSTIKSNIKNTLCEIDDNVDRLVEWAKNNNTTSIRITIDIDPNCIPSVEYTFNDDVRIHSDGDPDNANSDPDTDNQGR